MKKATIKDIEIQYNDEQREKVDYIINVINKNYALITEMLGTSRILSLIPTNEENIVYIQNFDDAFYNGLNKIFNNYDIQKAYNTPNILSGLYIEVLIRKLKIDSNMLVQSNSSISDEMLETLICYKYFEKMEHFCSLLNI